MSIGFSGSKSALGATIGTKGGGGAGGGGGGGGSRASFTGQYNADGTPKRTVGVWYPDICAEWTKAMDEGRFEFDIVDETSYDETVSLTDTNFRNNEHKLAL